MSSISTVQQAAGTENWASSTLHASCMDLVAYGSKRWNNGNTHFNSGLPTPPASRVMPGVVLGSSYNGYPVPAFQQDRSSPRKSGPASHHYPNSSMHGTSNTYEPVTASSTTSIYDRRRQDHSDADCIAPHLQIPQSVNKSKGSLAEFAAEITCLFWFETSNTLQYAENLAEDSSADRGLLSDAIPTIGFRKWVTTIVSTTQVGKNVVLLALMFIYRLKKFNPTVSGKRGSEFRLLTIALMLGNKFLDDNTYTNKTWAEVSGISVTEIHIMEVEFLSNMRYDLYASAQEWSQWKAKLGRLGAFYQKASLLPLVDETRWNGLTPVTPTGQSFPHKLPSPPSTHHSVSPYANSASLSSHYPILPHPSSSIPLLLPNSPLRQQVDMRSYRSERKRSADYSADLPPAKRQVTDRQFAGMAGTVANAFSHPPSLNTSPTRMPTAPEPLSGMRMQDMPRLDIPRLPVSIPVTGGMSVPLPAQPIRAMSGVYPSTTHGYSLPVTPISAIPQNLFQHPIPTLGDGQRTIANYPSAHTSPSNGHNLATPTLPGLSPSYFLTHRASPYRPVRHVNTLLIPPPAAALQAPVRNVPFDHIHYQPLSKAATDRKTGPLPIYQPDSGWQNSNVLTPVSQQQYQF